MNCKEGRQWLVCLVVIFPAAVFLVVKVAAGVPLLINYPVLFD